MQYLTKQEKKSAHELVMKLNPDFIKIHIEKINMKKQKLDVSFKTFWKFLKDWYNFFIENWLVFFALYTFMLWLGFLLGSLFKTDITTNENRSLFKFLFPYLVYGNCFLIIIDSYVTFLQKEKLYK